MKLEMKMIFCVQINLHFPISWFQHFEDQSLLQSDTIIID